MSSIARRASQRTRGNRINYNETNLYKRSFETTPESTEDYDEEEETTSNESESEASLSESTISSSDSESDELENSSDEDSESDSSEADEEESEAEPSVFVNGVRRSTRKRKVTRFSSDSDSDSHIKTRNSVKKKAPAKKGQQNLKNKKKSSKKGSNNKAPQNKNIKVVSEEYEYEYEEVNEEEEEEEVIQNILGQKDVFTDHITDNTESETEDIEYYVKFQNKAYIHCQWMKFEEIIQLKGGEGALKRWNNKSSGRELAHSLSIPSLLALDESEINTIWYEVDRIVDEIGEGEKRKYHVKWKGLGYDEATWEKAEDIPDEKIRQFHQRLDHSNPIKIPSRYKRPPPDKFKEIEEPIKDVSGKLTLRSYQMEGFNWLRFCWYNQRNAILADEMGLGKTVQIVSAINDLALNEGISGPFLVIAPLSTLGHWQMEFERWTNLNVVVYHGNQQARDLIRETEFVVVDEYGNTLSNRIQFDVLITNYETVQKDFNTFFKIEWRYLVLDEAHKLKNPRGKLYEKMEALVFEHCIMLTGTPIQNGVEELWGLLHFLYPTRFDNLDEFIEKYGNTTDSTQVEEIQAIIRPIMLRRKKSDVEKTILPKEETIIEVELTRPQKMFYRAFLHDNAALLLQQITGGALAALQNLMMQLRKVCNHPYLINGAEDTIVKEKKSELKESRIPLRELEMKAMIESSGKMILIDKLLPKLRKDHHKVLIFSQMVRILDIIQDFLDYREYPTERIDGSKSENDRQAAIERFNSDDNAFVFLLSTRAGGVGINLTSADTVIIYDSDWNPQNDIQAEARCHRIGQKNKVKVYRLITKDTYESKMFERASKKLGLDHVILDGNSDKTGSKDKAKEIEEMLRNGVHGIFNDDDTEIDNFCSADIDQILERSAKSYKSDVISGGESIFAHAKFNVNGNDENDKNISQADFWKDILPNSDSRNITDQLTIRRCRKNQIERSNSIDNTPIRKTIFNIIERGYKANEGEFETIRYAMKFIDIVDENHQKIITQQFGELPDENNKDEDEPQISSESAYFIEEKADKIVDSALFFLRLLRSLYYVNINKDIQWPVITPSWRDPVAEYALMVALHKYGKTNINVKIQEDTTLGLSKAKDEQRAFIVRRVMQLLEEIEKQYPPEFFDAVIPADFTPELPQEWKDSHPNTMSRNILYDVEIHRLAQALMAYGIPKRLDTGRADWERLKDIAQLPLVNLKTIKATAKNIVEVAKMDEPDLSKVPEISEKDLKRISNNISTMDKIYSFMHKLGSRRTEIIKTMPKFYNLEWWDYECDLALISSIAKYGLAKYATWMLDEKLPFRKHIPDDCIESFARAAASEKTKIKRANVIFDGSLPDELNSFMKEKVRTSRALHVINYVHKQLNKQKKEEEHQKQKEEQKRLKFEEKAKAKEAKNNQAGSYPIKLNQHIRLFAPGEIVTPYNRKFDGKCTAYPIGYKIERDYKYKTWQSKRKFRAEIIGGDLQTGPIFKVTILDNDENLGNKEFEGHTPSESWKQAIDFINEYEKQNKDSHNENITTEKSTTENTTAENTSDNSNEGGNEEEQKKKSNIPGITLFGLTISKVLEIFSELPGANEYPSLKKFMNANQSICPNFQIKIPFYPIPET
ncbi:SNF2 family N-terminal domain containing protein [Tritrichomonas foetus]|uniref:SNF2 family N-terminal domain containing protein n=1 Tax=Tritrichomonas foetus TaxID=1144522 RepID=A0A1J4JNL4_9EUKA|nr:SNF2 family N-terminal domain containing protein [Tritrichomonas foetus]|eukprot:OHS99099.1 SNF2 family N-terminal domain containing protein [Tritrichomonas foetus]